MTFRIPSTSDNFFFEIGVVREIVNKSTNSYSSNQFDFSKELDILFSKNMDISLDSISNQPNKYQIGTVMLTNYTTFRKDYDPYVEQTSVEIRANIVALKAAFFWLRVDIQSVDMNSHKFSINQFLNQMDGKYNHPVIIKSKIEYDGRKVMPFHKTHKLVIFCESKSDFVMFDGFFSKLNNSMIISRGYTKE